ncbi:histone deacetylase [Actinosynnema pretiosum]|uniref:Histone deacetylase n=1 Tax=Actinosynnema pretiosum TaxID=42197 RepID=A0A290ZAR1_9PSEU|nr:histone deacetylase [Actinosynnema pretiosum]ATE56072.1 histone deacetylase [Actinosynnema pretiosum]
MVGLVWYVSYGSNLHAGRFGCYLSGGTPPGAARAYPGCRDTAPPRADRPWELPGGVYFTTHSPVWDGGRAFYDPSLPGVAAGRAYLVTVGQFSDVAAQEMYREPGEDLDLLTVLATGRAELGPGRYETLVLVGEADGCPALTFTAPWRADEVRHTSPSAAYLRMLAGGLRETWSWTPERVAAHLAGTTPFWTAGEIAALL